MFDKILIANRGEIACRIIRTARRMGLATVAIYSEADRNALHVALADMAFPVGSAPASESYLNIDAILAAAEASGSQAVHPGYGFLSENADFAEACKRAGLIFVGPPAAAIRVMGSKATAKALMERVGVPVVPGYHGDDDSDARLADEAERLGFPVLIKSVAGGGGRGMRVVDETADFTAALAAARREATSAFGDGRVLLEKYLDRPRHIEVQIFADRHGNAVHIFDRDCSIQRRHQKIVEEAPAPGLQKAQRQAMAEAALTAAGAVGYVGAGTVEFIIPCETPGVFYFIEMNTRLQVEHTVTEAVTEFDLVEWQLKVAAGEPLPLTQPKITRRGHAIEARLYAEDPERGFLPQTGVLHRLCLPPADLARTDTGVRQGDAVTPFYDPMLAKIIVWGEDRGATVAQLRRALAATAVLGLKTNLGFLSRLAKHPSFAAAEIDTGFIDRDRHTLLRPAGTAPDQAIAAAAISRLQMRQQATVGAAAPSEDRFSPWWTADGWRLGEAAPQDLVFDDGVERRTIAAVAEAVGWRLYIDGRMIRASGEVTSDGALSLTLDGAARRLLVLDHAAETVVMLDGDGWSFTEIDALASEAGEDPSAGKLTAPMPGRVTRVLVGVGAAVRRGEPLMVIEAMKMEHTVTAPVDGIVGSVRFDVGERVEEGAELVTLATAEDKRG